MFNNKLNNQPQSVKSNRCYNYIHSSLFSIAFILLTVSVYGQKSLYIDTVKDGVKAGSLVSVSLRTKNFKGIVGLQGSLTWDTSTVAFNNISFSSESSIRLSANDINIASNYLTFLWTDASLTPNTVADTSILFTLSFTVKKDVKGIDAVALSNSPTPVQIIDSIIATPVSLKSFGGFCNGGKVHLKWDVSNDFDVLKYIVQQSVDAVNFVSINTIYASNKQSEASYEYTDFITSNLKNVYYRLLMLDKDGKYSFSKISEILITKAVYTLSTFPNPVKNKFTIAVNSTKAETISLKIISTNGNMLYSEQVKLNAGINNIPFDASNYLPGNYFITLNGDNLCKQQFIKL